MNEQFDCPACSKGHHPTGAHKCAVCLTAVHIFDQCSSAYPGEDEGYGQRRLCNNCAKKNSKDIDEVLSCRKSENWKNLNNDKENNIPKSFYLRKNFTENDFQSHGAVAERFILKNANNLKAKPEKVNGTTYSLLNTCCFDSIAQLLLKAMKNNDIRRTIVSWKSPFGEFVIKLFESGRFLACFSFRCLTYCKIV